MILRRNSPPIAAAAVSLVLLPLTGVIFAASPAQAQMDRTLQMPLGNPDKAQTQPANRNRYLIQRSEFAESYNDTLRFPNWVAWHLSKQDVGQTERGKFAPDTNLPAGFTVVTPGDYSRSGYDRGHNCPSKDRSDTRKNNDAVFLMSNMTPQAHGMNAGPWEKLESYSRDLASSGNEMFIYCGHGFSAKTHKTIGRSKVAVPDFGWKVVVIVPQGRGPLLSRITPTTRVIAVKMPNINTVSKKDWRDYRTSVQDIEAATGLVFFDQLPNTVAAALKNRVDYDQPRASVKGAAPSRPAHRTGLHLPRLPHLPHFPRRGNVTNANGGASAVPSSATVWVNLSSGVYWQPGTTYYGKTKKGKYMSQADAIKAGYHAAKGQ